MAIQWVNYNQQSNKSYLKYLSKQLINYLLSKSILKAYYKIISINSHQMKGGQTVFICGVYPPPQLRFRSWVGEGDEDAL